MGEVEQQVGRSQLKEYCEMGEESEFRFIAVVAITSILILDVVRNL